MGKKKIKEHTFIFFDVVYEKESIRSKFTTKRKLKAERKKRRLNQLLKGNPNSILICHNPPYGFVDKLHNGKHVGSKMILNAIKKYQPKLVFCGHIHEAKGEAKIGKTKVYNLGWHGDYKIIEV